MIKNIKKKKIHCNGTLKNNFLIVLQCYIMPFLHVVLFQMRSFLVLEYIQIYVIMNNKIRFDYVYTTQYSVLIIC